MRWHNSLGNDSIYSAAITERTILNVLYIFTKGDFLHRTKTAERVLANALVLVVCLIFAIGKSAYATGALHKQKPQATC